MLLGSNSGEIFPDLDSVPSEYRIETKGELLYRLCVALVERKLVDESLWAKSGKIPVVFARNAIQKLVDETCGESFKNNLEYSFEICDHIEFGYSRGNGVDVDQLIAMFDLQTAGFLIIGEAIKALNEQEPLLGAAFYIVLRRALWRRMRVYDHEAANWYNEQLHEMMDDDDPDNKDSYEFPPVDEAIPPSVKSLEAWDVHAARKLLRRHRIGPFAAWIEKLLLIERLSRLKWHRTRFESEYDDLPVPSLLIVFRENDAIQACWDHEAEHYNEASHEPTCTVAFRPGDPDDCDRAFRTMFIFLRLNIELAGLVNLLNAWEEKTHASERQHRTEPALRAA